MPIRRLSLPLLVLTLVAVARTAQAQSISLGAGAGIAASTATSLSDGRAGAVFLAQGTAPLLPFIQSGVELHYWRRSVVNVTAATAILQLHIPITGFFVKGGVGYGAGDPDGNGRVTGIAGQLGVGYDIGVPLAPVAFTLVGTGTLIHGAARSVQMVDAGLAITFR